MTDSKKQLAFIFIVILGALLLYTGARALSENDQTRIRKVIYEAALAVETQNTARYGWFISEAYHDSYGYDKAKLLKYVLKLFGDYKPFKIDFKQFKIEAEKGRATAEIGLKAYFKKAGDKETYYDAGEFKIHFLLENKNWKVTQMEFRDAQELFFYPNVA